MTPAVAKILAEVDQRSPAERLEVLRAVVERVPISDEMSFIDFGIRVGIRFGLLLGVCMALVAGWRFGILSGLLAGAFFGISVGGSLYLLSRRRRSLPSLQNHTRPA